VSKKSRREQRRLQEQRRSAGQRRTPSQARRAPEPRRPRQKPSFWRGPWPIALILGAIVGLVILFIVISRITTPPPSANTSPPADPTVISEVTHVSSAVTDAVGTAGAPDPLAHKTATLLTGAGGKPEMLYVGAEWCPFCAAERWAMVVALGRFGTFSGLHFTTSADAPEVFPGTHTLSFYGSTYTSAYLDFVPVEQEDRNRKTLQSPTAQQQQLMQTYDPDGSIPFIDIGNQYTMVGQGVLPNSLQGLSWQQIASSLSNPDSPVTKAIVGNANYLTAAICKLSGAASAPICRDPTIAQIAGQLP
jgi:thiol-disulfide isomerase/thioredoxin